VTHDGVRPYAIATHPNEYKIDGIARLALRYRLAIEKQGSRRVSDSHEPEDALPRPEPLSDVRDILKGFKVLKSDPSDEVSQDKSAADAFLSVVQDAANAASCVAQLFPNGIPLEQSFFDRLHEFRRWIGIADLADEAIGIVWSVAMQQLSPDDQLKLLQVFASQQGHDFFENVGSLHVVVKNHTFPPGFLADWFTDLVRIVEGDVSVDVWKSVTTLCESNTDGAFEVIWMLTQPPEERRLNIAGVMLGTMRQFDLGEKQTAELKRLEGFFESHSDEQFRAVYNWSWATTARAVGIDDPQLRALLARADSGNSGDLGSVVNVVCRICVNDELSAEILTLCTDWIGERVAPSLPAAAKYYIANAATHLSRAKSGDEKPKLECSAWITGIQPVHEDERGTWGEIQMYLYNLAKDDVGSFRRVLEQLCETGAATILGFMQQPRCFDLLLHRLQEADVDEMVGRLAMSPNTPTRHLAVFLFDKLGIEALPDASFEAHGDLGMRLLFHEVRRTMLSAQSLARLFVSMLRHVDLADAQFKNDLVDELKLQSRNFAGGCRQELEERGADLSEVVDALQSVDDYFQRLKVAHEAGINAMEVTGHRRAAMLHRRRFSQQVSEGAKEYSPFLSMMKKASLLYGKAASTFIDGRLQDAMPLVLMSSSMEIPTVDFCDPEEMALRRIHASAAIQRLLEGEGIETEEEYE
jgi:hypothetical protein